MGRFKHSTNVGFTLAAAGAIILSLEVIFLRSLSDINGFQIMLYRSVSVSFVFLSFILLFTNQKTNVNSLKFNFKEILSGFFLSMSFFCYVFSILNSSVASSLLILSISPVVSAILSKIFLNENLPKSLFVILVSLVIGLFIIFENSVNDSQLLGNSIAFFGAFFFAASVVTSRAIGSNSIAFGGFLAGIFAFCSALLCLFVLDLSIFIHLKDIALICIMGIFTTGLGMLLLLLSTKYLEGPYVSLIALLEVVLAPVWTLLFFSEVIAIQEVIGGILILTSICIFLMNTKLNFKNLN